MDHLQLSQVLSAPDGLYPFGLWSLAYDETLGVLYGTTLGSGGVVALEMAPDGQFTLLGAINYPAAMAVGEVPALTILPGGWLHVAGLSEYLLSIDAGGAPLAWHPVADGSPRFDALWSSPEMTFGAQDGATYLIENADSVAPALAEFIVDGVFADILTFANLAVFVLPDMQNVITRSLDDLDNEGLGGSLGAESGIGWSSPAAIESVSIGDKWFAVVADPGTSSLTVLEIGEGTALVPRDYVIDTRFSRFAAPTDLAVIETATGAFLASGGSDDGVSLFAMLPNGRLVHLEAFEDDGVGAFSNVTDVALFATDEDLLLVSSAEFDPGVSVLSRSLAGLPLVVMGTANDDVLTGSPSSEIIWDGLGSDVITGGVGADVFVFSTDGRLDVVTDFEAGIDRLDLSASTGTFAVDEFQFQAMEDGAVLSFATETIVVRSSNGLPLSLQDFAFGDLFPIDRPPMSFVPQDLIGGDGADTLTGGFGNDRLLGGAGNDVLHGLEGNDLLEGGTGENSLNGGHGSDVLAGGAGADGLNGEQGNDALFGGAGGDAIAGAAGVDFALGGRGHDTLDGGDQNDALFGGPGNDVLTGGAEHDMLFGGAGADRLLGGEGNDRISGGTGDDILQGELGADIFLWSENGGADIVNDFEAEDRIDFAALAGFEDQEFTEFKAAHLSEAEGSTVVTIDETTMTLLGISLEALSEDDFVW